MKTVNTGFQLPIVLSLLRGGVSGVCEKSVEISQIAKRTENLGESERKKRFSAV